MCRFHRYATWSVKQKLKIKRDYYFMIDDLSESQMFSRSSGLNIAI